MKRSACFLLILFICPILINAQQVIFKTYTVQDGLMANPVHRIFQDAKGFIWIVTWDGLSKYDGHKFTNFTTATGLSDNNVNDIFEDGNGKLYVALNTGVTDLIEHDQVTKKGIFTNVVINRFFTSPDHRVFAVTDTSGIWELSQGRLVKMIQQKEHDSYSRMISFNDSLFAVASPEIPIRIFDSGFSLVMDTKPASSISECIFQDSKKRIWAGTAKGLELFTFIPGKNATLKRLVLPQPLRNSSGLPVLPTDVLEEPDGNLWVATTEKVVNLKPDGNWETYSKNNGLPSKQITCLYRDKEKNIWIGSNLGLTKLMRENNIRVYTAENGLSNNNVTKLYTNGKNNEIYVGCPLKTVSIQRFDATTGQFSKSKNTAAFENVMNLSTPVLFLNADLRIFNQANTDIIRKLKDQTDVFCALVANDNVFIGTGKGIVFGSATGIRHDTALPWRITALLLDKQGCLWVGTWENGLYRISPEGLNHNPFQVENFTSLLPGKHIRNLFQDKEGNIWVGTRYTGALELVAKDNTFIVNHFDQANGLTSDFIRAISEDSSGNIWLGSFLGLDKLIRTGFGFRIFNFSRINDLFRAVADIVCLEKNEIWCGTTEGLVHIREGGLENSAPLQVYLSSVYLGSQRYQAASGTFPSLKYSENLANFEFTSAGFINEKQIMYSYRLLGGTDTSWSMPANVHSVSYASLQPNTYQFQVRTIGWNGVLGTPTVFRFVINPPFWRTWWFMAILAIAVIAILYGLYRYRINQLLQMQRVRNRLATDLHDDIGSTLTNISILSELGRKNLHQPADAIQFLQRITEEVSSSGQALDDIIWSVNSRNDSMQETLARMRRYAAELFDSSDINCHMQLEETVNGMKFLMEQRRDLYLIYKESLNNIYKHAEAKNVWVNAGVRHHTFELSIRDDGKGFTPGQPSNRNGLKNLRWRVEKWKGTIVVASDKGAGTHISISIPVRG